MANNPDYLIDASEIPLPWRTSDSALKYEVGSLVDTYGPFPVSDFLTLRSKWKRSGSESFHSYQRVTPSEHYQETIEGLRYNSEEFLALWGTTPGLYYSPDGTIPQDHNITSSTVGNWVWYRSFNTKYVNCIRAASTGYPQPDSVTPYWFYGPWLVKQMSYFRQDGRKENVLYSESSGNGLLWTFVNEENNSSNHSFLIWRTGSTLTVKENRPIKSKGEYYDTPTTYTLDAMFHRGRPSHPSQGQPFVVNILIAAGGGGGSGSSVGDNGDSGGSGAVGIFQVDLSQTTTSSPLRITLGGPGGGSKSGQHSYIQFYWSGTSSANAQGWRIGGGRCNSESDDYLCGRLTQPWGSGDSVIKKIWACDGKSWNNSMPGTTFIYGNQTFYFAGGSAGSDGGGAGSLFGDGGARHTGWINNGDSAHYNVGAGGGGGSGGGSGGEGGMSWMAIFY